MSNSLEGVGALPHLGVIRAQGEEAARFLHNQLTQDFALLRPDEARLAAFCNAKGRMLASFVGFQHAPQDILLVTSQDLLAPTLKRLSMFVLRAKVKLSDASAAFTVHGLAGAAAEAAAGGLAVWGKQDQGEAHAVRLHPADGQPRALWVAPAGQVAPAGPELPAEHWQWGEVRSGIAMLTAPVVEAFVPQMLNYESVGGVNFKKGCYPGQEVVARSQFRGTLKRRAFLVHAEGSLRAGQDVFHDSDASQPCGLVAQAAPAPDGGWDAIVSMQTSAADAGRLSAGSPDGPVLALQPLPYPLLADI
ncbi:MAG TPA: folate-binding protein [Ramlibacter sp.]|jgi:folate-binding protein YgfZ|uniref:CAF17-like 4Fe-4S cluster assembly/insertion protein YgfZ n=1 Tax=Ramlibacter sp. TaxID=1917967 RepID=UPI002D4E5812|nr:folate-binding protein [Ramlibacter sp.]HZY18642.1 folate-binding protein [Ramlibacter sp.]